MKRLKSILLLSTTLILLSFSLTGCDGKDETTKDGSSGTTTETDRNDNIVDDVKDGVDDVIDGVENGVNDITNDIENGMDDTDENTASTESNRSIR